MAHLALVTTSYPDGRAGQEAAGGFVADFARELAGHARVSVVAPSLNSGDETDNGLLVRRFAVPRLPLSLLNPARPTHWPAIVATLGAGKRAVSALVDDDPPDHILALWALPSGWWARSAGGGREIPYSTWALGSDIWSLGRLPLVRAILAAVLRGADRRYADGVELASDVEAISGLRCEFLPSMRRLDYPRAEPPRRSAPYRLGFLGRWHANKGTDLLMHALALLDDATWDAIDAVWIAGGGPLDAEVREHARTLQRRGHPVSVGGFLDAREAAELIGWADYLLLPSRIESIPVIFSDAVQVGTPLVATPVGDLPSLHERYGIGVLADAVTPEAYAHAIGTALRRDAASDARSLVSARVDFDLERTARKCLRGAGLAGDISQAP